MYAKCFLNKKNYSSRLESLHISLKDCSDLKDAHFDFRIAKLSLKSAQIDLKSIYFY